MRAAVAVVLLLLAGGAVAQYQPITGGDFDGLLERTDLAEPGDLDTAKRVVRFIQVSDAHILDDDAPFPMRVEPIDPLHDLFAGAARPQEEYTDEMLNRIIARINELHAEDEVDFVINTGDNIDNDLENELMRFIDNWDGTVRTEGPYSGFTCVPDGQSANLDDTSNDATDQCTHLPDAVAAANVALADGLPWFSAFGNHDGLIQGNVPREPSFQEFAGNFGRYFLDQDEYVGMHFRAGSQCLGETDPAGDVRDDFGHGYGFAGARLCDASLDNDGYYAFDLRGIRFVVLDTVNDDFVMANENFQGTITPPDQTIGGDTIGGYSEGAIDPDQFAWFQNEVQSHQDQLIIVLSHHTLNSMFTDATRSVCCGPNGESLEDALGEAGYATGKDVEAFLSGQPHVAAWIGGHTHQHRIEAKGSLWNIETSSVIDLPQESRVIEVWVTDDGKAALTTRSFSHDFELGRTAAGTDPQGGDGTGAPEDQDVLLWFQVPSNVDLSPQPSLPRFLVLDPVAPLMINGSHGQIGEPLPIVLDVRDSLLGAPATDLHVRVHVQHASPNDFDIFYTDEFNLTETSPGRYEATFAPEHAITHFASFIATDPQGTFSDRDRAVSWVIIDPAADEKGGGKDSSAVGFLALLGALAVAAARRR